MLSNFALREILPHFTDSPFLLFFLTKNKLLHFRNLVSSCSLNLGWRISLGQSSFLSLSMNVEPFKICLNWKPHHEARHGITMSHSGELKGRSAGSRGLDEGERWLPKPRGDQEGTLWVRSCPQGAHRRNKQMLINLLARGLVTFPRWTASQKSRGCKGRPAEPRLKKKKLAHRGHLPRGPTTRRRLGADAVSASSPQERWAAAWPEGGPPSVPLGSSGLLISYFNGS